MDITSLSKDYLEEATKIRKVYEAFYDVGHDHDFVVRAFEQRQPYWYAGMLWQVQKTSSDEYVFGMHLH